MEKLKEKLQSALNGGTFIQTVLSGRFDKSVKKHVYTVEKKNNETVVCSQKFMPDGKALKSYQPSEGFIDRLLGETVNYKQTDVKCADFSAVMLRSKKGALHIKYGRGAEPKTASGEKNYVLSPSQKYDFLVYLGVQDNNGRVYDKRQSKFRQINKFLEIVSDVLPSLPDNGIKIWDLCCGKSYLSFAVYYYFRYVLNKDVSILCVDRKADVIAECAGYAEKLGWDGMKFICGDIFRDLPDDPADLVLSLHACDTATDMVLSEAVKRGAKVILSSPCCQHEISTQIKSEALSFILREPVLKQKLSVVVTDALRCRLLYACGYRVTSQEFIDPDETPKNLMIRAEKTYIPINLRKAALSEYDGICREMSLDPTMRRLLSDKLSDLI